MTHPKKAKAIQKHRNTKPKTKEYKQTNYHENIKQPINILHYVTVRFNPAESTKQQTQTTKTQTSPCTSSECFVMPPKKQIPINK